MGRSKIRSPSRAREKLAELTASRHFGKTTQQQNNSWASLYYWKRCSYLSSIKQVSPKTWRIFTFADTRMTPPVPNPRGNYNWARLILRTLPLSHPPDFRKKYFSSLFWSLPRCLPSLRHFNICFELNKWQESFWLVKYRERIFKPRLLNLRQTVFLETRENG
jgi:hypothetical protein